MAAPITQAVGTPTNSKVNSTSNTNTSSTVKSDNGFCILASVYNSSSDSYIQNYQAIVFDAVTTTQVKRNADITSYAVEDGADVSDHVQVKNNTFSLSGIVSETPIRLKKDMLYSAGVNGTRVSQAITYLDQIFDARQPITVLTEHRVYTNVILTGISYEYKSEYAMQFDLDFEQVRLVSAATTNVIATKTASTKNAGVKSKTAVSAPQSNLTPTTQAKTGASSNG